MRLSWNLALLFFSFLLLGNVKTSALKEGDLMIQSNVFIKKDGIKLSAHKLKYSESWIDDSYRRRKKTEWRLILRDSRNKIIDSTYLVFDMNENPPHGSAPNHEPSKHQNEVKSASPPWEPYESAWINFMYQKNAHKVELLKNGKVLATTLVDTGKH